MNQKTIDAIRSAGQAIREAQQLLAEEAKSGSEAVSRALLEDAFSVSADHRFEAWKAVARMAQTVSSMEEQLKKVYFSAVELAAGSSTTSRGVALLAHAPGASSDVVDVPVRRKPKAARVVHHTLDAPDSRLKGNAAVAMEYLRKHADRDGFTRVTHADFASGAGLPLGSVGAAVAKLKSSGLIEEGERGSYKLL